MELEACVIFKPDEEKCMLALDLRIAQADLLRIAKMPFSLAILSHSIQSSPGMRPSGLSKHRPWLYDSNAILLVVT